MNVVSMTKWLVVLVVAFFSAQACSDNETTSVWDPSAEAPITVNPEIISISPPNGYLAGVDAITVTGTGFPTNVDDVNIYFSNDSDRGVKGLVQSATATELVVRPPQIVGTDLDVIISTTGTERLSNIIQYSLAAPLLRGYNAFNDNADEPLNITFDADNKLYVSYLSGGVPQGTIQIDINTEEQQIVQYVLPTNKFLWDDIGFVNGKLYLIQGGGGNTTRVLFLAEQGNREVPIFVMPTGFDFDSFDVDDSGHVWMVGNNTHIVRHEPQSARVTVSSLNNLPDNTKIYEFAADASAVFYFENKLYVVGNDGSAAKIWTLDLDANRDVVAVNEFANLSVLLGNVNIQLHSFTDMAMAADGTIYISTNRTEGIIEVKADGSAASGLYPGVILPRVNALYWQDDTEYLFISRIAPLGADYGNAILRVNMQKSGAPDYK